MERLAEDHANAKRLAEGLAQIRGIAIDPREVETNIVMFDIGGTGISRAEFFGRIEEKGVRMSGRLTATGVRAVTHLDIPKDGVERALGAVRGAVG